MKKNNEHPTSNIQRRTLSRHGLIGCSLLDVRCWMFPLVVFSTLPLHGQTNALPALLPPYGELAPTFWEQHATSVVAAGLGLIALAAFGLWLLFRPKPKIIIPPEAQAWRTLTALRQQPEDGVVLSMVSQAVRNYFIAAFQLAPGELTTTEFCREISNAENIGTELSTATADFLSDCDARKFSAANDLVPLDAANRALNLVEQAEQRRAQLRQTAATQTQGRRA